MEVNTVELGKGILIPCIQLISTFSKEIKKFLLDPNNTKNFEYDKYNKITYHDSKYMIEHIVHKYIGNSYKIVWMPHNIVDDIKECNNIVNIIGSSDSKDCATNEEMSQIHKELQNICDHHIFDKDLCNSLIFIGVHTSLNDVDLTYSTESTELLYSIVTMIPAILKNYKRLSELKMKELTFEKFQRVPRMWTFAHDCTCCT